MTEEVGKGAPSSFRKKQADFIRKHGYSLKSYFIALVAIPPAAIFIAFKLEQFALPWRIFAALFVLMVHGALLVGGAALIGELIDRWR